MHETCLFEKLFLYLKQEEKISSRKIKKIHVCLSQFGSFNETSFREHYRQASAGTPWETLRLEISKIPYGPEFAITRLDFA